MTQPFFEYPTIPKLNGVEGVASVGISLSASGRPTRAWLIGSTGNVLLDRAALKAALESRYAAEEEQCGPVGGDYKVEVDFSLDQEKGER